jgi:hypothetical protein
MARGERMKHQIIASKMYKRTRYEILFDGVVYWVVKFNPMGVVRFLESFETVKDANRGFNLVTSA